MDRLYRLSSYQRRYRQISIGCLLHWCRKKPKLKGYNCFYHLRQQIGHARFKRHLNLSASSKLAQQVTVFWYRMLEKSYGALFWSKIPTCHLKWYPLPKNLKSCHIISISVCCSQLWMLVWPWWSWLGQGGALRRWGGSQAYLWSQGLSRLLEFGNKCFFIARSRYRMSWHVPLGQFLAPLSLLFPCSLSCSLNCDCLSTFHQFQCMKIFKS